MRWPPRPLSERAGRYFKAALYLSAEVDRAAIVVRDQSHMILVPYFGGSQDGGEFHANKSKMRFLMLEYMREARADLGRTAHALQLSSAAFAGVSVVRIV